MPLTNIRVLITRTRHQASTLAEQLQALGATPILIPTIELAPPASFCALDAALAAIRSYDWLIFTSANAVEAFESRAQFLHVTARPRKIAAIGPATARAVEKLGLQVDLIPPRAIAESLAEALIPHALVPAQKSPGDNEAVQPEGAPPEALPNSTQHHALSRPADMLLLRAEQARDLLPEALTAAGANLTLAAVYRNVVPPDAIRALQDLLASPLNYPHAVTFTSASTATNLFTLLESARLTLPATTVLASIGPITSATLRELGYQPTFEASEPTIAALVAALESHFNSGQNPPA